LGLRGLNPRELTNGIINSLADEWVGERSEYDKGWTKCRPDHREFKKNNQEGVALLTPRLLASRSR